MVITRPIVFLHTFSVQVTPHCTSIFGNDRECLIFSLIMDFSYFRCHLDRKSVQICTMLKEYMFFVCRMIECIDIENEVIM